MTYYEKTRNYCSFKKGNYFSELVKGNAPYVKAAAVIGLSGLISIMYSSFLKITGRNIKLFKTKEEALDYLVSS